MNTNDTQFVSAPGSTFVVTLLPSIDAPYIDPDLDEDTKVRLMAEHIVAEGGEAIKDPDALTTIAMSVCEAYADDFGEENDINYGSVIWAVQDILAAA